LVGLRMSAMLVMDMAGDTTDSDGTARIGVAVTGTVVIGHAPTTVGATRGS